MTEDDSSRAAVKTNLDLPSHGVLKYTDPPSDEHYAIEESFRDGLSARVFVWLHAPWICSVVIMIMAVSVYFIVHPWPGAFNETVLAIIVGGTTVNSGTTALIIIHNKKTSRE